MSYFKAKMYQNQFRLGLTAEPAVGAYSAPPDPLAGLKGPTSNGKGRDGEGGGKGRGGRGRRRKGEGRGRDPTPSRPPNPYFWIRLWACSCFSNLQQLLFVYKTLLQLLTMVMILTIKYNKNKSLTMAETIGTCSLLVKWRPPTSVSL